MNHLLASLRASMIGQLAAAVGRRKTTAIACCVAVSGLVAVVNFMLPATYRSEARLLLRLGRENATLDPTTTLGQDGVVAVPSSRDNEINSVVEILQGRALLEKVVDALGPDAVLERGTSARPARPARRPCAPRPSAAWPNT